MISLGQLIKDRSLQNKGKTFIYYADREIKYEDIERHSNMAAHAFGALGISKGDHVALMLPNCPEYIFCWFGLAKLGAVTVTINTRLRGDSLEYIIKESDSKALVLAPEFLSQYREVATGLGQITPIAFDPKGAISKDMEDLNRLLKQAATIPPPEASTKAVDPLIITFTSGTTGLPKLVINSHRAYICAAEDLSKYAEISSADRIYTHLPLYHANPQVYCVLTALAAHAGIVLAPRFSASAFWEDTRKYRATAFSYVGAVLPILLAQPQRVDDRDNPVKKCFGGGAPKEIYDEIARRFGVEVLELYGMSETGTWNTINRPGKGKSGTVGTIREGFDIRIVDMEDNELPPGEIGEIVVRPQKPYIMFDGYYKNPEETTKCSGNWWFHTGDLGKIDEDGYYYFCGRKKETIRRGGENIPPGDIEKVINQHPAVLESAAVGIPDPVMEEEIKVAVVPRKGLMVDPAELHAWCQSRLPRFMTPRYLEIMDELPKSASEKIKRTAIKEQGLTSRTWEAGQERFERS